VMGRKLRKLSEGEEVEVPAFLQDARVVVVDTETTGFDSKRDRIIEIGAIWINRGRVVTEFGRILNPGRRLPLDIMKLTGITQSEVDAADPFWKISSFVVDLLEAPSVIVAYNSPFDMGFLKSEIERAGREVPRFGPVIDPLKWTRHEDRGKSCKLGVAAARRGIEVEGAHRAVDDCRITLALMNTLKFPSTLSQTIENQKHLKTNNYRRRGGIR